MMDIVLEILSALILLGILIFFARADRHVAHGRRGWLFIQIGFLLLLFGAFMDVIDNFEALDRAIVIGDISMQSFLEKFVGYFGGFAMVCIGFMLWLPTLQKMDTLQKDLAEAKQTLEYKVMERTSTLEKEFDSRRKIEAALRQTEEHRQILYENAPIGISHGLIGGSLVVRNAAFARMLGYDTPAELDDAMRESGELAFFWRDKQDFHTMVERLRTEKHIADFETCFEHKDGSDVWVHLTFSALEDRNGKHYYFYSFADDITERKLATDALAESEMRLATIIDSLPAGVILVDAETQNLTEVNSMALDMLGYDREDLVGHHCCSNLCPKKRGECPILDQHKEILNREVKLKRKDGVELQVTKSAAMVTMEGRKYLLETFVNISEQKRLDQLRKDVDHIIRHDLKSPVVSMINACSVLLLDENVQGETREILELIQQQGNKALRLAGMSLAIYRMEKGTYTYEPQSVDFMDVVRRVVAELADRAHSLNVAVRVILDGIEPSEDAVFPVMGNDLLCDSMFANLLANALEASPEGAEVTVSLQSGDAPTVVFANVGAVPADIRENFFDKFVSYGKKTGTGLGTYSASLSVQTMEGAIEMDTSDEENTTTLIVRFPEKVG